MKKRVSLRRTRQVHVLDIICSSYFFYSYALYLYYKDIIGYLSHELLQLCNNLDLAVREVIAFLILKLKFHNMPSPMKLEQERSIVTPTSTSGNTKVAISPFDIKNSPSFLEKRKCVVSLQCTTYQKSEMSANILWAFFMSTTKHIRFHAPVSMVNALTAFWCSATGQRETVLLFIQRFYKQTF